MSFTVSPEDSEATVLGKSVSALQSGISITNSGVSGKYSQFNGTLKYVTDYTGFSSDPELQEGNYLVMRVDTDDEDDEITVELLGGRTGHPVTLDPDRNIVLWIENKDTEKVRVVVNHVNEDTSISTETTTLSLKGLTLEPAPNP